MLWVGVIGRGLWILVNAESLWVLHVVLDDVQELDGNRGVSESMVHCIDCVHDWLDHNLIINHNWLLLNLARASYHH